MELEFITEYIISIAPAITSIITVIVSMIIAIKKVINAGNNSTTEVKETARRIEKQNDVIRSQLQETQAENRELKRQLRKVMNKLNYVHFVDKEE